MKTMRSKHPRLVNIIKYVSLSFALSHAILFGLPAQYPAPLCLVAPTTYAPVILITLLLCIPLTGFSPLRIYDLTAAVLLLIIRTVLQKKNLKSPVSGITICIFFVLLPIPFLSADTVLLALNRVISAFITCLAYTHTVMNKQTRLLTLAVILSSLSGVSLLGMNLAILVAVILILHIADFDDPTTSAYLGIYIFVALSLPNSELKIPLFLLVAGTLIACLKPSTHLRRPLYLTCFAVLFGVLNVDSPDCIKFVFECFLASTLYVITLDPLRKILTPRALSLLPEETFTPQPSIQQSINLPLGDKSISAPTPPSQGNIIRACICSACRKQDECNADKLLNFTLDAENTLEECPNRRQISNLLAQTDKRFDYISDRCKIAISNTQILSSIMDISTASISNKPLNLRLSRELTRRISRRNRTARAWAYTDRSCIFSLKNPTDSDSRNILETLLLLTGVQYHITNTVKQIDFTYIHVHPKPNYSATSCCESLARSTDAPSGDIFTTFMLDNHAYFILCDGMGTGREAHTCAKKLLEYFKSTLTGGMNTTASLKFANTVMRITSVDESFAAIDVLEVNLADGSATLYKAGGASSYLLGSDFSAISQSGYPIGVLDEAYITETTLDLSQGGEVVLCSDGAELTADKLEKALSTADSSAALCQALMKQNSTNLSHNDDICVAVVTVHPRKGQNSL